MSTDIATLGIKVDASDVRNASGELRVLVEVGNKAEKATDGVANSFGGLKTALAGLGLGAMLREAGQLADTYSNIQGRLSLVTNGTGELASVTEKLFESAQRARASFEATADLYSSLARSTKSLGTSQADLLSVTETINKALLVSGASAATAEGALVQLGQGFASGTLRGDELNSVLEGTPRLAQAIADGMGVTVGQLRALGAQGKITGETVFNALKSQKEAVEAEFARMPTTIGQSFVQLRNEILKYVGEANSASGASAIFAGGVSLLAKNLDTVVPAIGALGIALGIGFVTRAVAAQVAAAGATGAFGTMAVAARGAGAAVLGAFGGPVGIAITGVALAIGGMAIQSARAEAVISTVNRSYDEMRQRLNAAKLAADGAAGGTHNVGTAAHAALPGVDSLTGSVKSLADQLYRQADAAKKARIAMAAERVAEADRNELAASALTPAARNDTSGYAPGGIGNMRNWGRIASVAGSGLNNFFNNGEPDRAANAAYRRAFEVSQQARKELRDAHQSLNGGGVTGGGASTGTGGGTGHSRSGGGSGTSAASSYDSAVEGSRSYVRQLQIETENIGKNAVEQRLADAAREAARAPTAALRQQILDSADAWASATVAQEVTEAATRSLNEELERQRQASQQAQAAGSDMADQIRFEAGLQRMSAEQRAVAIAQRDMENKGIREGTVAYMLYSDAILDAARSKGQLEQQAQDASAVADHMRAVNDNVRAATDSFANLFGTAGKGFADLIQTISDYAEQSAAAEARIAEARSRYGADSVEAKRAEAEAAEEASARELATYGRVIGGVKGLFKEKSAAYKVMEGVEKAYAAVRLAMAIREILTEGIKTTAHVAGAGTRIATDAAETASSVSKSGIRAAADGVAAFAKTLASLPFPFNLAAGAAVLAALVGVGVKIAGGGGKGASASAEADTSAKTTNAYTGPVDEYGQPTSSYSVLGRGRTTVANDNGSGITVGSPAGMASGGNVTNAPTYHINIEGNADDRTVAQLQQALDQVEDRAVARSREAVARDNAAGASRQRIGGSR